MALHLLPDRACSPQTPSVTGNTCKIVLFWQSFPVWTREATGHHGIFCWVNLVITVGLAAFNLLAPNKEVGGWLHKWDILDTLERCSKGSENLLPQRDSRQVFLLLCSESFYLLYNLLMWQPAITEVLQGMCLQTTRLYKQHPLAFFLSYLHPGYKCSQGEDTNWPASDLCSKAPKRLPMIWIPASLPKANRWAQVWRQPHRGRQPPCYLLTKRI